MIDLKKLEDFLFTANKNGYAANETRILPQRPGFKELEYREGEWYFRDSYAGWYMAPGQEVVYFKDEPVWTMAYTGGMKKEWHKDEYFTSETLKFLKEALLAMDKSTPFRGPSSFKRDEWCYLTKVKGDTTDFTGNEKIYNNSNLVFEQNYIGGLIINKENT